MGVFLFSFLVWFGLVFIRWVYRIGWDVHKLPQSISPTEPVPGHVVPFGDSIIGCSVGYHSWAERGFGAVYGIITWVLFGGATIVD